MFRLYPDQDFDAGYQDVNTNHYVDDDDDDADDANCDDDDHDDAMMMMSPGLVLCGTLQVCEVAFA